MKNLKITLAQINPILGDLKYNTEKIIKIIEKVYSSSDLIIFPELCIVGYPPEDLIFRNRLLTEVNKHIENIHNFVLTKKVSIIIGVPLKLKGGIGNAAIYIRGKTKSVIYKNNLPNYGVFDEKRIFIPGPSYNCIKFKGKKLGLMICEDMWTNKIAKRLLKDKADLFVCINASPYDHKKQEQRIKKATDISTLTKKPLIYVNQVGGQDELVFDGGSFVIDANGNRVNQLQYWKEDLKTIDIKMKKNFFIFNKQKNITNECVYFHTWSALVLGLRDYVYKNGFKKVILGLSGGIDSAVSAVIAVDALGPKNVIALKMPSRFSSKGSLIDANKTISLLGIKSQLIKITDIHSNYTSILNRKFKGEFLNLTNENLQSRIRGSILMAYSNNYSYLLISTGNKSEMSVGYSTIYGDMNGGFNVLKDIYKTNLYKLANWRNSLTSKNFKGPKGYSIPKNSINKPPSAELSFNQKDTDKLPTYEILDKILYYFIEKEYSIEEICDKGFSKELVKRIRNMLLISEYKRRQAPPGVKISIKSFGKERRYPITNQFKM